MLPPLMPILQRPLLGYRASADKQISQICAHRARRFLSLSAAQIGRVAALLLSALRVAGRLAMPVMTQRASGDPVCLCIGALGVNVRTCRVAGGLRRIIAVTGEPCTSDARAPAVCWTRVISGSGVAVRDVGDDEPGQVQVAAGGGGGRVVAQ
jgi:hypothetical protein